jgi:membrane fusion protein (multidrug efflux system)
LKLDKWLYCIEQLKIFHQPKSMNIRYFLILISLAFFISCQTSKRDDEQIEKREFLQEKNLVDVLPISRSTFTKEIISNGKLKSIRKSDLQFKLSEVITDINVSNGTWVKRGQVIARLDGEELKQKYRQAEIKHEQSKLEMADFFLSHAQLMADTTSTEGKQKLRIAEVRSGLADAKLALEMAKADLEATVLRSPINGKISNLYAKIFEHAKPGEVFCTVIDDSKFEVQFQVIESEISSIAIGKEVKVTAHANEKSMMGKVMEINPTVDENGLISVKAVVANPGSLFDGMNVKVLIKSEVDNQLIVPKTAVVLRQNQEVLFVYKNGIAFWTYVQTQYENSDSYAVIAHPDKNGTLEPGDTVIVNGNLNLAHESEVEIDEFLK